MEQPPEENPGAVSCSAPQWVSALVVSAVSGLGPVPGPVTCRGVPLVWGPVGSATLPPVGLLSRFGPRALAGEGARAFTTGILRRTVGHRVARTADLVVALNDDTARHFAYAGQVLVEHITNAMHHVPVAPSPAQPAPLLSPLPSMPREPAGKALPQAQSPQNAALKTQVRTEEIAHQPNWSKVLFVYEGLLF